MATRVGVIGTGALGQHHVRILSALPEAELVGIYDLSGERSEEIAARHGCAIADSFDALAGDIEAAVVAVPTVDHCEIGCNLLERGVHVLVEKPIAIDDREAEALIAAAGNRVLAVGHVEYFNPAVQALLGLGLEPGFVEVHRMGVFSPRSLDIDVVLDLMIHDLQILHALDPSEVKSIHAVGVRVLSEKTDIASVRLELASGCVANLTASRVSAEKVRKLRVFAPPGYYSLDYQSQKVGGFRLDGDGAERTLVQQDLSAPH
ncbi:MAG: Gfo/Idh/MocA family oxidoreductase, partial [Acidobacteriota bacterium]|nr:Gfo/Idh/MocA family oxidoreductase [Acidobacteriota bacterium]